MIKKQVKQESRTRPHTRKPFAKGKQAKPMIAKKKTVQEPIELIRLNKLIADAGVASRRHADELIEKGAIRVNGNVITELGYRAHPGDNITVHGEPISYRKHMTYIILNKPKNVITTTSDDKGRKTVMDLVPTTQRLFPVGRLDRDTTGLLLLTNDGELANRLLHPKFGVARMYKVGLDKPLTPSVAKAISEGVDLEDGTTAPCQIMYDDTDPTTVYIELREGKNREVRRIFQAKNYEVKKLERKSYANLSIRGMKRGTYRHLSKEEIRELEAIVGLQSRSFASSPKRY